MSHTLVSKRRLAKDAARRRKERVGEYNSGNPLLGLTPWSDPGELVYMPPVIRATQRLREQWVTERSYAPLRRADERVPSLQWLVWQQLQESVRDDDLPPFWEELQSGAMSRRPSRRRG